MSQPSTHFRWLTLIRACLIAEEVGQIVPEVVSFEASGKHGQGVDDSRLTAVLIEADNEAEENTRSRCEYKICRAWPRELATSWPGSLLHL